MSHTLASKAFCVASLMRPHSAHEAVEHGSRFLRRASQTFAQLRKPSRLHSLGSQVFAPSQPLQADGSPAGGPKSSHWRWSGARPGGRGAKPFAPACPEEAFSARPVRSQSARQCEGPVQGHMRSTPSWHPCKILALRSASNSDSVFPLPRAKVSLRPNCVRVRVLPAFITSPRRVSY
ncbi:hypothetical protein OH77DRAFT_1225766 [Trametes cingulata]|nr:hypothetical protein OH77DRAFT_1225766 [Trametes cingulata]